MIEVSAISKYVRVAPRKLRLLADALKNKEVDAALTKLSFLPKSGTVPMVKALKSAVANAVNVKGLTRANLKIKNILIDEGFKMKRRGKGRKATSGYGGGVIQKRTSHITVILQG